MNRLKLSRFFYEKAAKQLMKIKSIAAFYYVLIIGI